MPIAIKLLATICKVGSKLIRMGTQDYEKGSIAICFVEEALRCVRNSGFDVNELVAKVGISPELLTAPNARVSPEHYGALWHLVAQTLDDEFFGMDRRRMKAGSFTMLCHSIIHSETLERALLRTIRFFRLVLDDLVAELTHDRELAYIHLRDLQQGAAEADTKGPVASRAFACGTFMIVIHGLACWIVRRRIPICSTEFRCDAPDYADELRTLFCQQVAFNRESCQFSFPARFLSMPNVQNERTMKEFLRVAPANFLVKYRNSSGLTAKIRRQLRGRPPARWPDFGELANQLNTSTATLRRRLNDEGESYRTIVDGLRRDMAISLLSNTELHVADIADKLGFAEYSAFHRAFKKWTGVCPGDYRVSRT